MKVTSTATTRLRPQPPGSQNLQLPPGRRDGSCCERLGTGTKPQEGWVPMSFAALGQPGSSRLPNSRNRAKHLSHQKRMFRPYFATTPSTSPRKRQLRLWLLPPASSIPVMQVFCWSHLLRGLGEHCKLPWGSAVKHNPKNGDKKRFLWGWRMLCCALALDSCNSHPGSPQS